MKRLEFIMPLGGTRDATGSSRARFGSFIIMRE